MRKSLNSRSRTRHDGIVGQNRSGTKRFLAVQSHLNGNLSEPGVHCCCVVHPRTHDSLLPAGRSRLRLGMEVDDCSPATRILSGPVRRTYGSDDEFFGAGNVQRALLTKMASVVAAEEFDDDNSGVDVAKFECTAVGCDARFSSLRRASGPRMTKRVFSTFNSLLAALYTRCSSLLMYSTCPALVLETCCSHRRR